MVFANVLIKGWTTEIHVYSSSDVPVLAPHYTEVVNCCGVTYNFTMVIYRVGALRCSMNLSLNILEDLPTYSSPHSTLSHLNL